MFRIRSGRIPVAALLTIREGKYDMLNHFPFLPALPGLLVLGLLGCGSAASDKSLPDVGPARDAASVDAGTLDAGAVDTGGLDAAAVDAESMDAESMDAESMDAASTDAGSVDIGSPDAGPGDAGPADVGSSDAGPVDVGSMDAGPVDVGSMDAGNLVTTPMTVTPTYVHVDGTAPRGTSAWAIASSPIAQPQETRSTTFFGRFVGNACAAPGYGPAVAHPFALGSVQGIVQDALFPDCQGAYGPSVDASVIVDGVRQHLLRSEVRPAGAFETFGASGQNGSGANAYILATYTAFNPRWRQAEANRFKPWNASPGPIIDPNLLRVAFRMRESVTADLLADPATAQLQQVLRFVIINESCNISTSPTFCQLELNFKTYNRGLNAYTSFATGNYFGDLGQGGLIAVVGPIGSTGQSTTIGGRSAWTSWGSETQLAAFTSKTFQVEVSWRQFLDLMGTVTAGNPQLAFGPSWNDRSAWVLLRAGYGQENYNTSPNASSLVEGLFDTLEIFSLAQ